MKLEFSKLYGAITALQMPQIHEMWTFTVRLSPVGGENPVYSIWPVSC